MIAAIFAIASTSLSEEERGFFREAEPAGYILFARNCDHPDQLRRLTDQLRDLHGRERLFIGIDQEGGRVARLKPPHWSAYPAGEAFDRLYQRAPASAIEAARANAEALALDLAQMGITVDFHPPLDLRCEETHEVIGDRALGSDPLQVAALGRAILDGLARGGVVGCVKHIPGHGRATCDSHKQLPRVRASAAQLERDIEPFRLLRDAPMAMSAHLLYEAWDRDQPATFSRAVIERVVRGQIGFDGLLLTDDIDMDALEGPIAERAQRALAAGCDLVLNCWAKMADMRAIAERTGAIAASSERRLEAALAAVAPNADLAARDAKEIAERRAHLIAKRDALLKAAEAAA